MKRHFLGRDQIGYRFAEDVAPRLTIAPGDIVEVQTHDARSGKLRKPEDVITTAPTMGEKFPKTNPATGPIFVSSVEPGDELLIEILAIDVDPLGFIIARPEWGSARNVAKTQMAKMLPVEGGFVKFDSFRFPVRPMVGVLATAPKGEGVSTLQMGDYGGNMDCKMVRPGTTVHLPVFVDGGLLFVGDVHAAMGDAEAVGTGCEIDATVTLRVDVRKRASRGAPWMENDTHLIGYGNGATFELAAEKATLQTMSLVAERTGVEPLDAFLLIGLIGDVRVNQACNAPIDVGARIEIEKALLRKTSE